MYREQIRNYYDHLSRSYRRVADFVMSNYYEVAFMTAAELAFAVGVDTTTVVRFSQRLGFKGYPAFLDDIRSQVKAEIYAAYEPQPLTPGAPPALFKQRVESEQHNLGLLLAHSPPDHLEAVAQMLAAARSVLLIGDGYAESIVGLVAQQFHQCGLPAQAVGSDPTQLAGALANLTATTLVIGVSAGFDGRTVARALDFARSRGCLSLGVIGALDSEINRAADRVIYAPSHTTGTFPSIVGATTALAALVMIVCGDDLETTERQRDAFADAYGFLTRPEVAVPEETE